MRPPSGSSLARPTPRASTLESTPTSPSRSSYRANMDQDEAAFRQQFGAPHSSGIDFGKYADIPVEVELPRDMDQLPPEMAPVQDFIGLKCGRVLGRNLRFTGFQQPPPVQVHL